MMTEVKLGLIEDPTVREAISSLYEDLRAFEFFRANFKYVEITFTAAIDNFRFYHNFGFKPTLAFTAFVTDNANVIWDLDESTKDYVLMTVSAPCTVRAFLGRYQEGERV